MSRPASNTRACFQHTIGRRVVGVLFDALPVTNRGLARGNKTLIFEDGTGLTFASNGSFWTESAEDIERAVRLKRRELERTTADLDGVLALAGERERMRWATEAGGGER